MTFGTLQNYMRQKALTVRAIPEVTVHLNLCNGGHYGIEESLEEARAGDGQKGR